MTRAEAQTLARIFVTELLDQLERRGILPGATDPRRERRIEEWRGQEKDIESEDHTNIEDDGESKYWDQKAREGLKALEKGRRQRKRQQDTADNSRDE